MQLHTAVIILRLLALAALGVLGVFIFGVDPVTLTIAGQTLFFFSFWLMVTAVATLGLVSLARRFLAEPAACTYLPSALRQGTLIGGYAMGMVLAQYVDALVWWVALLSLVLVLLIEFTARQFSRS